VSKGNGSSNYLVPYTDPEMVYNALLQYANKRHAFAQAISQKGYKNSEGSKVTKQEISFAYACCDQADRLVGYAKEKVESPIIQIQ
jgi:hypothetical protein